jgi:hypothetical protein
MSSEVMADVAEPYRVARNAVEACVNEHLKSLTLATPFEEWAFIGIVRPDDHPDYPEICRKNSRRKVLEFRLKISHSDFAESDSRHRKELIIDALKRSVRKMPELGVPKEDCEKLMEMLCNLNV